MKFKSSDILLSVESFKEKDRMEKCILSIIIPTKNRQYYALNSVKQILSVCGRDVEIVVQDNSDEASLKDQISELGYENIVYNYTAGVVSFVDNFDLAIQLSNGKYAMIIGDDDGITSLALKVAKWADNNDICCVKPALSFIYFWPGSKVFDHDDNGILHIYKYNGNITKYDPREGVKSLLGKSCQDYLNNELIKLYHGIVRRDLLEAVRNRTGRYVGGLSPDIYLSVALSLMSKNEAFSINVPLTISGICTGSGSSQSATGEHTGSLEEAPHFRGHTDYKWNNKIPKFYSVETIWGDSAMAAVSEINPDYAEYYEPETLTFRCLRKYPLYKAEILSNYLKNGGNKLKLGMFFFSKVINKLFSIVKHEQKEKLQIKNNLDTIIEASKECELWLEEHEEMLGRADRRIDQER